MNHSRRSIAVVLLFLLTSLSGTAEAQTGSHDARVTQFRGDARHAGSYDGTAPGGYGGILWRADLPGPVRSAAAVVDDVVYVGSAGGFLHALDRWTGRELWRYRTDGPAHGSPAHWNGTVYVTDGAGTLHAVDARTGEGLWTLETGSLHPWAWGHESGDLYLSAPVLAEVDGTMRLWFGAGDGALRAVDPVTGVELWSLETDGRIRSTPAVSDGRVVVGSADGSVYAAAATNGRLLWRFDTPGRELDSGAFGFDRRTVQSSPAIVGGRVYVGTRSGSLFAIDLETGVELWESSHGSSWVNGGPAVADGRVFAGSSDGRFIQAVDAATGEELWRRDSGVAWSSPLVAGGAVHFTESNGVVRALDAATGSTLWGTVLPDDLWGSPVIHDGVLFVGTDDGFYALRGSDGSTPFHRAVFWDSTYTRARWYLGHERLADQLEDHLYELLDERRLTTWLQTRVEDGEPSALVMALDRLPDAVRVGGSSSLFRRYLESGGTVVAPGLPTGIWVRELETGSSGGLAAVRWDEASELLDVDLGAAIFDEIGVRLTPEGVRMGLPESWTTNWTVDPQEDLEPLAIDENGRFAAWRKSYGGPPGTGYVRIWPSRMRLADVTPFLVAAEHRPLDPEQDELPEHVRRAHTLDAFVRDAMRRLGVPGLSFSAVTAEGVTMERGWGVTDTRMRNPVGPGTGFYIASSTKSFVGLLTLLLDREGWLDVDAPLTECLPGLDLNDTVDPSSITLRDLVRHTRGWESDPSVNRTAYTDFLDPGELRRHLAAMATVEDDGYFAYDNIGFVVADLCFRERLGIDWKELVETRILAPLGMRRTTPFMSEAAGTGDIALPHLWDGRRHHPIAPKIDDIMHAAGGLVTTAHDAARWIRVFLGEGVVDGRRVFPAEVIREALRRQVDADLSFWEFTREGYTIGWYDGSYRGERLVHHFGGYTGAQAHISMMPEHGLGVAAFINGGGGSGYVLPHLTAAFWYDLALGRPDAEELARARLDEAVASAEESLADLRTHFQRLDRLRATAPTPANPERYTGIYRNVGMGNVIVSTTFDGHLWIEWGAREGLVVSEDGELFADWNNGGSPDPISFDLPEVGPARSLTWERRVVVPRVVPGEPSGQGS